ncbi:MAG: translational GTPase TypA [Deltaproteobacteria bacterium]|nr:translational GTPase TypA [Deltaproteobacteria bacterium]
MKRNEKLRNIAIIAHVDHGKTTLVDNMFKQCGLFRSDQVVADRLMDTMDLEKERGITIEAKNCSVNWKGVKINIIDTPGHADFGGEVERALSMANGAILLVDASEGPLPQTRFVLRKALEAKLSIIVVINKIDRKDARPYEVLDEIYNLFIDLDADEDQLDFPLLYAVGRDGIAQTNMNEQGQNLNPLLDSILKEIPAPDYDPEQPFQMLVSDLGYSDYVGRLAIGKVAHGSAQHNNNLICIGKDQVARPLKISMIQLYEGLACKQTSTINPGDIVVLAGIENVEIGDTICSRENPKALPRIAVDEPTVSMRFSINTSPFSGEEGKYVQSRKIQERLTKETLLNVSIKIELSPDQESFIVKGRGEFQIAILIETMRREGFELCVGRPEVIVKEIDGKLMEPIEHLVIDCEDVHQGIVIEKILSRKAKMENIVNTGSGRVRLELSIPSRSLIGYRDEFLTDTKGTGLMNSYFEGYQEHRGAFASRSTGSIVADRKGRAVAYGLFHLEPRGELFIKPTDLVYEGMIVGERNVSVDLNVNPCKEKKQTNIRAAARDENIVLTPTRPMTLERAIHFINEDEMVEVTPLSIRLRKTFLNAHKRHVLDGKKKARREKNGG